VIEFIDQQILFLHCSPQLIDDTQALDGCPKKIGIAAEEFDVRLREVPWRPAVDLQHAEGLPPAAAQDQNICEGSDPMILHEVVVVESDFLLDVVGDDGSVLEG
jgi:hypothetical protein